MYEYKLTKIDNSLLRVLPDQGWEHYACYDEIMYWKKKITKKKIVKECDSFPEWQEFIVAFRNINKKGSYDKKLISKYKTIVEEYGHKTIMDNLKDYKLWLEVNKTCPPVMVSTYLNQYRFLEKHEIIQDMSRKFINDIYKELDLNSTVIDNVNTEISAYEAKHKREVTDGVVRNIIHYVQTGEI